MYFEKPWIKNIGLKSAQILAKVAIQFLIILLKEKAYIINYGGANWSIKYLWFLAGKEGQTDWPTYQLAGRLADKLDRDL